MDSRLSEKILSDARKQQLQIEEEVDEESNQRITSLSEPGEQEIASDEEQLPLDGADYYDNIVSITL